MRINTPIRRSGLFGKLAKPRCEASISQILSYRVQGFPHSDQ